MRRYGVLIGVLALLTVGGCQTDLEPSSADLKAQWDAQNVYPQHYKVDLLAYLRTYLNDPTHIRDAGVSQPQLKAAGPGQRFVACVRYNARKERRPICRLQRRRRNLRRRQARPLHRRAEDFQGILCRTRSTRRSPNWNGSRVETRGDSRRRARGTRNNRRAKRSAAARSDKEAVSKRGRRGHLTLRFSADVFPRFSTSSN